MIINLPNLIGSGDIYLDIMRIICGDTSELSMIDLGCHKAPYTSQLGFKKRMYIDAQERPLDNPNEQQYFVLSDMVEYIKDKPKWFDVVISSDSIEHISVEDGFEFINFMTLCSNKQIIFTPIGETMMHIYLDNDFDTHKSGWTPEMLPNWLAIVLPDFHPTLNTGAWFAVNCEEQEKTRIFNQIKLKYDKD
jgi:hypothetical protein